LKERNAGTGHFSLFSNDFAAVGIAFILPFSIITVNDLDLVDWCPVLA
jgi:hypothetical protein